MQLRCPVSVRLRHGMCSELRCLNFMRPSASDSSRGSGAVRRRQATACVSETVAHAGKRAGTGSCSPVKKGWAGHRWAGSVPAARRLLRTPSWCMGTTTSGTYTDVFSTVALPVRRRQAEGGENAVWETIQQAISSNAKTARFLVIMPGAFPDQRLMRPRYHLDRAGVCAVTLPAATRHRVCRMATR
jgi:hypothetical protein